MNNRKNKKKIGENYTFIDLFAGIGGFHQAFHNIGAECVFSSEWDENARKTYELNFKKISPNLFEKNKFIGDINSIKNIKKEIPDFDILTGGFPCQPFSHAGHRKGFLDTRGTLFFNIVEILRQKKPKAFFIENVRGLLNHDDGNTFSVIKKTIEEELNYSFYPEIIRASDFGLPQHRPRLFMVGFKNKKIEFEFPDPVGLKMNMSDIWGGKCSRDVGFTLRCGGRGSGLNDRRNWDTYLVDGKERRLSSAEGKKMMGFPKGFKFPVSETQAMRQLGNAVAVPAIQAVAQAIIESLNSYDKRK
ncbi:MAG: DNA cytosine methyltransferase [Parcubacteria group bacterium]|jgi:DNA (cytosine-5)-methyltransferase 1